MYLFIWSISHCITNIHLSCHPLPSQDSDLPLRFWLSIQATFLCGCASPLAWALTLHARLPLNMDDLPATCSLTYRPQRLSECLSDSCRLFLTYLRLLLFWTAFQMAAQRLKISDVTTQQYGLDGVIPAVPFPMSPSISSILIVLFHQSKIN